mmetsp:Transcript_3076/g.8467  ORF Transcript_3076/g.8467 Transcript_3076/m.8467 type:complete len:232 (+) Transcript_3076:456-1151(+)
MGDRSVPRATRRGRGGRGRPTKPRRGQGGGQNTPDLSRGRTPGIQHSRSKGFDRRTRARIVGTGQRRGREQPGHARRLCRLRAAARVAVGKQPKGNGRSVDVHTDAETRKGKGTKTAKSQASIRGTKEEGRNDRGRNGRASRSKTPGRGDARYGRNICGMARPIQRRNGRSTRAAQGGGRGRRREKGKQQGRREGSGQIRATDGIPALYQQGGRNPESGGDRGSGRKRPRR